MINRLVEVVCDNCGTSQMDNNPLLEWFEVRHMQSGITYHMCCTLCITGYDFEHQVAHPVEHTHESATPSV